MQDHASLWAFAAYLPSQAKSDQLQHALGWLFNFFFMSQPYKLISSSASAYVPNMGVQSLHTSLHSLLGLLKALCSTGLFASMGFGTLEFRQKEFHSCFILANFCSGQLKVLFLQNPPAPIHHEAWAPESHATIFIPNTVSKYSTLFCHLPLWGCSLRDNLIQYNSSSASGVRLSQRPIQGMGTILH